MDNRDDLKIEIRSGHGPDNRDGYVPDSSDGHRLENKKMAQSQAARSRDHRPANKHRQERLQMHLISAVMKPD